MIKDVPGRLEEELASFRELGATTAVQRLGPGPVYVKEFWTARQRAADQARSQGLVP